ncbi:hypothetical protein CMV_016991 [Castanea mollissima]|uniref:Uncharacterized protein n=1 Tax=Castanea mollissima TaxID=60419 RepID=A0A8J4R778_9ROSI|nr:hypothetical protein CMV_016991 [Castanea mollissima]
MGLHTYSLTSTQNSQTLSLILPHSPSHSLAAQPAQPTALLAAVGLTILRSTPPCHPFPPLAYPPSLPHSDGCDGMWSSSCNMGGIQWWSGIGL